MKSVIIIRSDGGTSIGMGHVTRCLALAEMLQKDFSIVFAIQEPTESVIAAIHTVTETIIHLPATTNYSEDAITFSHYVSSSDIVVLDGYHFKTDYQRSLKDKGCKLVVIDDLHAWPHVADVIINHAPGITAGAYLAEQYTKLCLGADYVLLRKEFLTQGHASRKIKSIRKAFISMGAADVTNVTSKFTEALTGMEEIEEIHLMISSINPHIRELEKLIEKNRQKKIITHLNISARELVGLLQDCDLSICPASSISLESCAIGIALVSGYTADNQLENLSGLEKRKTLVNFGNLNLISVQEIRTMLQLLSADPEQLIVMIENQKKLIDGRSPERLTHVFKKLAS